MFQATFAAITVGLIVGAFAERMKFSAVLLFAVLWFTFAYLPIAHMVWFWPGPDGDQGCGNARRRNRRRAAGCGRRARSTSPAAPSCTSMPASPASSARIVIGKRVGYGKESMAPHNLTFTMIGASLLWVGWFGFNAGSALEAGDAAALAFVNTLLATAARRALVDARRVDDQGQAVDAGCRVGRRRRSGRDHAGLRLRRRPTARSSSGSLAGVVCLWGVNGLKRMLGADDALDVFGVHGVGGILGAMLTGVFAAPELGGQGIYDYVANKVGAEYSIAAQLMVQGTGVLTTIVWSGVVAFIAYKIVDMTHRPARHRRRRARRPRHQLARRVGVPHVERAGRSRGGAPRDRGKTGPGNDLSAVVSGRPTAPRFFCGACPASATIAVPAGRDRGRDCADARTPIAGALPP